MNQTVNIPEAYKILEKTYIEELKSEAWLLKHEKSGARVAVLSNEDINKVFHVAFRTPPKDSTGVAHILEHSVLCGSDEFPVKDPFVELVKGSLNTFLNAMTYSDKTVYPVASCNDTDFQNLMHVYLDAVFRPNIYEHKEIFLQEGWHYELESVDGPLKYNGVVYNEMKGAFSSPEQVLYRKISQTLYPDTTYGVESGGDPANIPDLSYEQFLDFHRRYYHPSNAWLYLYGNMDVEEKLRFIDEHYLSRYDEITVDSSIKMQAPFETMQEVYSSFAVSDDGELKENTYLSYNVVVGTSLDRELYLGMQVLEYVLMSSPGAVLKKALLESGIGQDVFGELDNGVLQPYMSIIVKNAEAEQKEDFMNIIRETLTELVKEGISRKSLMAAINYYEFKYREGDFGRYPAGLMYGLQMMDSWLYDERKPFIHIQASDTFELLKEKADQGYFEQLIQKYLLDNNHSSLLILTPEKGLTEKTEAETAKKLAEYKAGLSAEALEAMTEQTKALKKYQEEPSAPEDMEKIPILEIEDIEPKPQPFYNHFEEIQGYSSLYHDVESRGIVYVKWIFDTGSVPFENIPYIGLLSSVLGNVDTKQYDYTELADEINIHTGGIRANTNIYTEQGSTDILYPKLEVVMKVLLPKLFDGVKLMGEIMSESCLSDTKRLKEIIGQLKSRLEMMMNGNGHTVAVNRATSFMSLAGIYREYEEGMAYYRFIEKMNKDFEAQKDALVSGLEETAKMIFRKENLLIDVTGSDMSLKEVVGVMTEVLEPVLASEQALEADKVNPEKEEGLLPEVKSALRQSMEGIFSEAYTTAGMVQYDACAGNFARAGYAYHGALSVLKVMMNYDYLWIRLRVQGGAYGCMCGFSPNGTGYFTSYRDPNLKETYDVYEGAVDYVKNYEADERTMRKFIIGAVSGVDVPLGASDKGARSLSAWLTHTSYEKLEKNRYELLHADVETIRSLYGIVDVVVHSGLRCVVGNAGKIQENKDMFQKIEPLTGA
ncbi:insulinase family protein [Frisingicoccus sp.]|uniref:insulinase family protein n=1 Tax=Frisingicoccus sp. TaxID=1918627 RepID=UPI003AB6A61F